ncbi:C6 transcription factor [Aspergillus varians]
MGRSGRSGGSTQSSGYGHACVQCYKAKCRCVRAPSGNDCERCLRLMKKCQPSASVRRRDTPPHPGDESESEARLARLEDKMERVLATMQSFVGSQGSSALPSASASASTTYFDGNGNGNGVLPNTRFAESPHPHPHPNPRSPWASPNHADSDSDSDKRLNFFRTQMLPSFPFLDLTAATTSRHLRQTRPFLLQAIQTVTTFSTQDRLPLVEELKRRLSSSALLAVQSNIDLLLGLLTYIAWSTDAFLGRADLVSRLMMLAVSLVYDLRLFRPSEMDVRLMMAITQGGAEDDDDEDGGRNRSRSSPNGNDEASYGLMEGQRAVLACFVLSSNISSHIGRQDALRWTPQMDDALRVLTISKSSPGDELFVAQVRMQLLKQKADYVRQQDEPDEPGSAPRLMYLKSLRRELHELRSSFPRGLQQIDILTTHAHYVELSINHQAYSIRQDPPLLNLNLNVPGQSGNGNDNGVGLTRLECLWHSVENIKSWLDAFQRIPSATLIGLPFHFWSQMVLTITLLKYLSTLRDPDWDVRAVRDTVSLVQTIDWMRQRLELGGREAGLQFDDHLLAFLAKLLSRCRMWAEGRWDVVVESGSEAGSQSQSQSQIQDMETRNHGGSIPDLDQMVWMQDMDLGDDRWFEDVLGMPAIF